MAQDISLIQIDPNTGRVTLKAAPVPISGINLLTQVVYLSLMNTPGQDVLDPDEGGGIPEMIGMNIDATDSSEVIAELSRRVKKSQTEIINSQTGLSLNPEEKLSSLFIAGVRQGETPDEFLVTIRIINEAGRISDIVI